MTLEELKAEAKKHGYKLTKEYKYEKLEPCPCGNKRIVASMLCDTVIPYFHRCNKCGFASEPARTKYEARHKWNELVENAKKEKNNA